MYDASRCERAEAHVECAIRSGLLLSALLLLSQTLAAQGNRYLQDTPGDAIINVLRPGPNPHKITPVEAAAYEKSMQRIRDLLLAQPVFHPVSGVRVRGELRQDYQTGIPGGPIPGFGHILFYPSIVLEKTGKPGFIIATTEEVVVSINNPVGGLTRLNGFPEPWFYEPDRAGDAGGFPVYRGDLQCEYLVLSRDGGAPWTPVTREEFVRAWMAYWKKQLTGGSGDQVITKVIAGHEAALAAMTPEQKGMQARYLMHDPFGPPLAPVGSKMGIPLVKAGDRWFDPSAPRSAIQLLTIKFWYSGELDPDHPRPTEEGSVSPLRVWETLHRSDWKAMAGLVR